MRRNNLIRKKTIDARSTSEMYDEGVQPTLGAMLKAKDEVPTKATGTVQIAIAGIPVASKAWWSFCLALPIPAAHCSREALGRGRSASSYPDDIAMRDPLPSYCGLALARQYADWTGDIALRSSQAACAPTAELSIVPRGGLHDPCRARSPGCDMASCFASSAACDDKCRCRTETIARS